MMMRCSHYAAHCSSFSYHFPVSAFFFSKQIRTYKGEAQLIPFVCVSAEGHCIFFFCSYTKLKWPFFFSSPSLFLLCSPSAASPIIHLISIIIGLYLLSDLVLGQDLYTVCPEQTVTCIHTQKLHAHAPLTWKI